MDRAGQSYWDSVWTNAPNPDFHPDSGALRDYRDKVFAHLLRRALIGLPAPATVAEAGCADSILLPYLGRLGYRIAGLDYSPTGCEQLEQRLKQLGLSATIECADLFKGSALRADLVISNGLVEHFEDTAAVVRAVAALSTNRVLTIIPNMRGLVGLAQKLCAPSVYNVHVPVSLDRLRKAHEAAGLHVLECDYLLPMGFGVVNYHEPNSSRVASMLRRGAIAALGRLSWLAWSADRYLPRTELLSPYCYCLAHKG